MKMKIRSFQTNYFGKSQKNSKANKTHTCYPGATAAANAVINDRLFQKHGRWASDFAKDGYVCENINEKLLVLHIYNI
jgi:hypothetical protein